MSKAIQIALLFSSIVAVTLLWYPANVSEPGKAEQPTARETTSTGTLSTVPVTDRLPPMQHERRVAEIAADLPPLTDRAEAPRYVIPGSPWVAADDIAVRQEIEDRRRSGGEFAPTFPEAPAAAADLAYLYELIPQLNAGEENLSSQDGLEDLQTELGIDSAAPSPPGLQTYFEPAVDLED